MTAPGIMQASAGQAAAADPNACVWVGANAGAGKTTVLIDRVTRLLLAGAAPAQILCVTYTKTAAAEMESRLFRQLGGWATQTDSDLRKHLQALQQTELDSEALRRARRLFARALETPGGLKIRTIHAFCEGLLRRFPVEAGIPPHFEVLDSLAAAELYAHARDRMLGDALSHADLPLASALSDAVRLTDETGFIKLADAALQTGRCSPDEQASEAALDAMRARMLHVLDVDGGMTENQFLAAACSDVALPVADLRRAASALALGSKTENDTAGKLMEFLNAEDRHLQFDEYKRIFLTAGNEPKKNLLNKAAQKHDPGALEILQREQSRLYVIVQKIAAINMAWSSAAAMRLGSALRLHYAQAKAQRNALDYDDLIALALDLLKNQGAAWVHFKLDAGISHILVDEAQDTSPDQWEIIRLLSDEFFTGQGYRTGPLANRTIFAVGDEKQSIYSFQGASPESFARMREVFAEKTTAANLTWRNVALTESFRSTRRILQSVDDVFNTDAARAGLMADGGKITHLPTRPGPGRVEIWPPIKAESHDPPGPWDAPLDAPPPSNPRAMLAQRIAACIKGWLDSATYLPATGRPIQAGDIIILVQRRNDFVEEMIRKLKDSKIPVAGADRMFLTTQISVMDLIALGQFVLLPEDDLTLAAVLRSPLIGFSEDELFLLAHGRNEARLWDALQNKRMENEAFAAAHRYLSHFLGRADQAKPYEFFADALGPYEGRRKLLARLGPDANDAIDEFLTLALRFEQTHAPSMQAFLQWAAQGRTEIKRDMEHGGGAVRVMTVHGAKGLEAPIVFLPDTCSKPDGSKDPKLLPVPGEAFHLWPVRTDRDDAAASAAREAVHKAREEEYHRQLYVAMTRARDWLIICGYEGAKARPKGCWYHLIEAALIPQAREVAFDAGDTGWLLQGEENPVAPLDQPEAPQTQPRELPKWMRQPAPEEPFPSAPLTPSRLSGEEPPVRSPRGADSHASFKRGLLIHHLLQALPETPEHQRRGAAQNYLAKPAHDLPAEVIEEIVTQTLAVITAPQFAAVFAPGSFAEVPLAGVVPALGGMAVSGQIDRLCVTEDEILIVDYKTNRDAPQNAAGTPSAYLRQMAVYRAALQAIYPGRAVRCALLWTDTPALIALPDSLLDQAAAELLLDAGGARS